jgi:hypothetical protein
MTTGSDRKNVAGASISMRAPGFAQPHNHEIASSSIEIREREASHAAFRRGADRRQIHQRLP